MHLFAAWKASEELTRLHPKVMSCNAKTGMVVPRVMTVNHNVIRYCQHRCVALLAVEYNPLSKQGTCSVITVDVGNEVLDLASAEQVFLYIPVNNSIHYA